MRASPLLGLVFLGLLAVGLALATDGEATHIRGGSLSNVPDPATLDVTFDGWWAERLDWAGHSVGDVVPGPTLEFGDGNSMDTFLEVTATSAEENWWRGRLRRGETDPAPVVHTYASPLDTDGSPWHARLRSCCRLDDWSNDDLDAHVNNPNGQMYVGTTVDLLAGTPSPVIDVSPVITCPRGGLCERPLAFLTPPENVTYRGPNPGEALAGTFAFPGPPYAPDTAEVRATDHVFEWDTQGLDLPAPMWSYYSYQFIAVDGAAETAVDVMVRVVREPLYWEQPAACRPAGGAETGPGASQEGYPTQRLQWTAVAWAPDPWDHVSRVEVVEAPEGVVVSDDAPTDRVTVDVVWVPTEPDEGSHTIVLRAYNATGSFTVECRLRAHVLRADLEVGFGPRMAGGGHVFHPRADWTDVPGAVVAFHWTYQGPSRVHEWPPDGTLGPLSVPLLPGHHRICLVGSWRMDDSVDGYVLTDRMCRDVHVPAPPLDRDSDGLSDERDNCPGIRNRDQADGDGDGVGDACGPAAPPAAGSPPATTRAALPDIDRDGIVDDADNCPRIPNWGQQDLDDDGEGDVCDDDVDGDRVPESGDGADNCPRTPNPGQEDADRNGRGDVCDEVGLRSIRAAGDGPDGRTADLLDLSARPAEAAPAMAGAKPVLLVSALLMAAAGILLITVLLAQPRRRRPRRAVALTR